MTGIQVDKETLTDCLSVYGQKWNSEEEREREKSDDKPPKRDDEASNKESLLMLLRCCGTVAYESHITKKRTIV